MQAFFMSKSRISVGVDLFRSTIPPKKAYGLPFRPPLNPAAQ